MGTSSETGIFDLSVLEAKWFDFVANALADWNADAFSVRRTLGGKSGATVLLVDISTPKHAGQGVLKLSDGAPLETEQSSQKKLADLAPSLEPHLPNITHHYFQEDFSALLLTVVGGGLLETEMMAAASGAILNSAAQKVANSLFTHWNEKPEFDNSTSMASKILEEWLEHRVSGESRIPDVLRNILNVPSDAQFLRYRGIDYPNPFAFSLETFSGGATKLSGVRGSMHGDLHCENILISGARSVENFYFIDFEFVKTRSPLFFDHAYLELHTLLTFRENTAHQKWHALCQHLSRIEKPQDATHCDNSDDQGLLWTIGLIRSEIYSFIEKHKHRKEDLKKQALLARVAAGLNFANKRSLSSDQSLSEKKKFFSFLYAAEAAKQYFEYCKLEISGEGALMQPQGELANPTSEGWRDVWNCCGEFQQNYGVYILISGKSVGSLNEVAQRTLGRLPWSLVIDFDEAGTYGNFNNIACSVLSRHKTIAQLFPHQFKSLDIGSSSCWFFADSDPDQFLETPVAKPEWRRKTLPPLRSILSNLHKETVPMPAYLVILGDDIEGAKLRNVFTTIEEAMDGHLNTVVVSPDKVSDAYVALCEESDDIVGLQSNWNDLALGVHQMLGDAPEEKSIWVPVRNPENNKVSRERLSPEDAARFGGEVELVPALGSDYGFGSDGEQIADFYKGNTITWHELDLHLDVDRDVTGGGEGITSKVLNLLRKSPSDSFAIEHSPGAGGTTVARRVAWEIRNEYPCVILNSLTNNSIEEIDYLFHKTNLPILIVAEAARISATKRDMLYSELKGRNTRFVILDVRRRFYPRNTKYSAAVQDPMSMSEARRFLSMYEPRAIEERRAGIRDLATGRLLASYRSAFFFGLYAFERDFLGVDNYVISLLSELSEDAKKRLAQMSLISRYSQSKLPLASFLALLKLDTRKRQDNPTQLLGEAAAKLLIFDGKGIGITHPILAEEILVEFLSPKGRELKDAWLQNLPDFCLDFIEEFAASEFGDNNEIKKILVDLFIERNFWSGTVDALQFSALISQLPSQESQRRVLEALCLFFPSEAHFWNHLGRHINFLQTGTFEEAEQKLFRAIELEPADDVHQHGLGMVYRFEVKRRLEKKLETGETARQRLKTIEEIFSRAEKSFETARQINPVNEYPLVTPIQMIVETFERLSILSGDTDYQSFLLGTSYVSEWCRDKIDTAEVLMTRLRHIEANAVPSQYSVRCDARLEGIRGNFEGMVSGLNSLLARADIAKPPVRRMLANAYVRRTEEMGSEIKEKNLKRVVALMRENLTENPGSGSDIKTWFRAYRRLPSFTLTEAIEQITHWSLNSASVDARYYLYVLHFIQARRGVHKSLDEAKKHLEYVRHNAPPLLSRTSFEWWGGAKDGRLCPLIHHTELGKWSKEKDFFDGAEKLDLVEGRIDKIRSPQSGEIRVFGMPAFFVPRNDFRATSDVNAMVKFNLGFSYDGLRAWRVSKS